MKQWTIAERGGSGLDAKGRALCRDRYARQRLLNFGFSEKFLTDHWYVLERDRRPPHELQKEKACRACGATLRNDFRSFPKEIFGDRKLGRHTTGDVCRTCVAAAVEAGAQRRAEADRVARAMYGAHGDEMWEPK